MYTKSQIKHFAFLSKKEKDSKKPWTAREILGCLRKQIALLDTFKHKGLRKRLIEHLASRGITDEAVLAAMEEIPRHFFVEGAFAEEAYLDKALPIHSEQTISQPFTVAYQTQLLTVKKGQKVLEIGTGSGYQAAILAQMGVKVYSVERDPRLYRESKERLSDLGLNVIQLLGDGSLGWPEHSPYDGIIITAASPQVPPPLIKQLSIGAKLVAPIGKRTTQKMTLVTRLGRNEIETEQLQGFRFVPLIGKYGFEEKLEGE